MDASDRGGAHDGTAAICGVSVSRAPLACYNKGARFFWRWSSPLGGKLVGASVSGLSNALKGQFNKSSKAAVQTVGNSIIY